MLVLYIVIARTLAKISIKKIPPLQVKLQFLQGSSRRGRGRGGNNYRTRSRFKRLDDDLCRKNHNKTHKHTHLDFCLFVYRIYILFMYTLSSIVVVFLWIFRRFSLVAFAGCTAHVHCFHETATALATGHGTTEFSRLSPLSVNRTHSLSLSLASPTCSRFSAASRALLMIARATPTKYLTTFLYTHTYIERDTIYDRIHRIFSWKTHMTNDSIANGKANSWLRVAGVWQAGRGTIFFAFHWEIFLSDFLFFLFWKNP